MTDDTTAVSEALAALGDETRVAIPEALGRAYEDNVPEDCDVERNESAIHMDMTVDMSEDSTITVDGELVQRDGAFWFEDEFEG